MLVNICILISPNEHVFLKHLGAWIKDRFIKFFLADLA